MNRMNKFVNNIAVLAVQSLYRHTMRPPIAIIRCVQFAAIKKKKKNHTVCLTFNWTQWVCRRPLPHTQALASHKPRDTYIIAIIIPLQIMM